MQGRIPPAGEDDARIHTLYPASIRDLLIRLGGAHLFQARWTTRILDECFENLVANRPDLAGKLQRTRELMERALPDARVDGYEELENELTLPDPDDRHVLAAAIRCGARSSSRRTFSTSRWRRWTHTTSRLNTRIRSSSTCSRWTPAPCCARSSSRRPRSRTRRCRFPSSSRPSRPCPDRWLGGVDHHSIIPLSGQASPDRNASARRGAARGVGYAAPASRGHAGRGCLPTLDGQPPKPRARPG